MKLKCYLCKKSVNSIQMHQKIAILNEDIYKDLINEIKDFKSKQPIPVQVKLKKDCVELYNVCEDCLHSDVFQYTDKLFNEYKIICELMLNNHGAKMTVSDAVNPKQCYCCKSITPDENNRYVNIYISDALMKMIHDNPLIFKNSTPNQITKILNESVLIVNSCEKCLNEVIIPKIKILEEHGVSLEPFNTFEPDEHSESTEYDHEEIEEEDNVDEDYEESEEVDNNSIEKTLSMFGENLLSDEYINKIKDNIIVGRDKEVQSIINILSKRDKNNPLIIGEPGVGKTSVVNKLCLLIHERKVPLNLQNVKVYEIKISDLIAGTRFRGDLEEKLKKLLNILKNRKDIIVFLDEIHQLTGSGHNTGDGINISDMLKPALSKGEITCIGATTLSEYNKTIERDAALRRRFQPIHVKEPTEDECIVMLKKIKEKYEKFHAITIKDELIEESVRLSVRYLKDRFLPDKALDLLDQAGALMKVQNNTNSIKIYLDKNQKLLKELKNKQFNNEYEKEEMKQNIQKMNKELKKDLILTTEYLHKVLNDWTGIDIAKMSESEIESISNIKYSLEKKVIGQENATETISNYIKRYKLGLQNPNRPIGVHLFVGPTGTGKTELAEVTSLLLTGNTEPIRFNMSEFSEKHEVSKFIGSPPGYIGHEEGGLLTEAVKRNPFSVILLDEIEKSHPEVWNILLQVFDKGMLMDGRGDKVDFRNTMIIMTSNLIIDSKSIKKNNIGFSIINEENIENNNNNLIKALRDKGVKPEFINRIDEIIMFNELSIDTVKSICVNKLNEKMDYIIKNSQYISALTYSPDVVDFITKEGYDKQYGARPMVRAIEKYITNNLTEYLLNQKSLNKKNKLKCHVIIKDNKVLIETK